MKILKRSSFALTDSNSAHIDSEFQLFQKSHGLVDSPNNIVHIAQDGQLFKVTVTVKSVVSIGGDLIAATGSSESFNKSVNEAFKKLSKQIKSIKSRHAIRNSSASICEDYSS